MVNEFANGISADSPSSVSDAKDGSIFLNINAISFRTPARILCRTQRHHHQSVLLHQGRWNTAHRDRDVPLVKICVCTSRIYSSLRWVIWDKNITSLTIRAPLWLIWGRSTLPVWPSPLRHAILPQTSPHDAPSLQVAPLMLRFHGFFSATGGVSITIKENMC